MQETNLFFHQINVLNALKMNNWIVWKALYEVKFTLPMLFKSVMRLWMNSPSQILHFSKCGVWRRKKKSLSDVIKGTDSPTPVNDTTKHQFYKEVVNRGLNTLSSGDLVSRQLFEAAVLQSQMTNIWNYKIAHCSIVQFLKEYLTWL